MPVFLIVIEYGVWAVYEPGLPGSSVLFRLRSLSQVHDLFFIMRDFKSHPILIHGQTG